MAGRHCSSGGSQDRASGLSPRSFGRKGWEEPDPEPPVPTGVGQVNQRTASDIVSGSRSPGTRGVSAAAVDLLQWGFRTEAGVRQRVVANLGRLDQIDGKKPDPLIHGLQRALGRVPASAPVLEYDTALMCWPRFKLPDAVAVLPSGAVSSWLVVPPNWSSLILAARTLYWYKAN